jgi:hypothetical protein
VLVFAVSSGPSRVSDQAQLLRVLVFDDNPFLRRALEGLARRRPDLALETFPGVSSLADRVVELEREASVIDLVVLDGQHDGRTLDAATHTLVHSLVDRAIPVALMVTSVKSLPFAENVMQIARPIALDELIAIARWRARKPASGFRWNAVRGSTDEAGEG